MVLERRYDLLLEIVKLSQGIISLAKTNQALVKRGTLIFHGAEPIHISPLKTNWNIEKNWNYHTKFTTPVNFWIC